MHHTCIIILTFITFLSKGQNINYCDLERCTLDKNNEAHFDPYYNGHLCENFNPNQADFSEIYLKLQQDKISVNSEDITEKIINYTFDFDSLFSTLDHYQNGIIGLDYSRIKIHISESNKIGDKLEFTVKGKSKLSDKISDFEGKIIIHNILEHVKGYEFLGEATLFATYEFSEDSSKDGTGLFKGIFECAIVVNHIEKKITLDESFSIADGYHNRTYVGIWKSYDNKSIKKCIWGDYRLPFTFDFDCGDGEMLVCEKYVNNGWTSFNDRSDFQANDKWWK